MTKHGVERRLAIRDIPFTFERAPLKQRNPQRTFEYVDHHNEINKNADCLGHESYVLPQEMCEIQKSMQDWELYMYCKEHEARTKEFPVTDLPPVRNCDRTDNVIKFSSQKYRCDVFTYPKIEIRPREECWLEVVNKKEETDKALRANIEKCKGNRAFKDNDFIKACEHYSNCIALVQLKDAYNNRAMSNMKMKNYSSALLDLNEVLKTDPFNEKALFRRATCRREIRMYNEALEDVYTFLKNNGNCKEGKKLLNSIKQEMAKLNGKTYRIRQNFNPRKTFNVDVSQLPVYAICENEYLLEVDKTGCAKSCVCGYCIEEDHRTRFKSTSLRIKERDRWKRLTSALLDEMRISSPVTTVSKDLKKIHNNDCSASPVKLVNGEANSIHEMSEFVDQSVSINYSNKLKELTNEYKKVGGSVNLSCDATATKNELKSIENSKNVRDQQSKLIEDLFSNMHLDKFKNIQPSDLKKNFDSRLDYKTLTNMIRCVCELYQSKTEWSLISEYLSSIAALERFKIIISFVDEKTKSDLNSLLSEAVNSNLENAAKLKEYFSQ